MVAQDVEEIFPQWIDPGTDGYKRLTFRGFEALTVEAVRELATQTHHTTTELTSRIDALEKENIALRTLLAEVLEKVRETER